MGVCPFLDIDWILRSQKKSVSAGDSYFYQNKSPHVGEMCVLGTNPRSQTINNELEAVFSDLREALRTSLYNNSPVGSFCILTDHWKANLYSVENELVLFEIVECMGPIWVPLSHVCLSAVQVLLNCVKNKISSGVSFQLCLLLQDVNNKPVRCTAINCKWSKKKKKIFSFLTCFVFFLMNTRGQQCAR